MQYYEHGVVWRISFTSVVLMLRTELAVPFWLMILILMMTIDGGIAAVLPEFKETLSSPLWRLLINRIDSISTLELLSHQYKHEWCKQWLCLPLEATIYYLDYTSLYMK